VLQYVCFSPSPSIFAHFPCLVVIVMVLLFCRYVLPGCLDVHGSVCNLESRSGVQISASREGMSVYVCGCASMCRYVCVYAFLCVLCVYVGVCVCVPIFASQSLPQPLFASLHLSCRPSLSAILSTRKRRLHPHLRRLSTISPRRSDRH
jgi:hypothetical protein